MKPNDLHPDLQALFDEAASLSDPNLKGMGEANRALADNPEFVAKVMGGMYINKILHQLDVLDISKSQLAKEWGKDRQYISSILNAEKPKNFTLKTMVELSMKVGLRMKLEFEPLDSASENGKMLYLNNEDYPETRVAETPADYNVNRNVSSNSESK
ncbi:MAG: hypothetical protein JRJ68_13985 [Deltaproteobacteria bacterium]|nr:hypothetical protein [Deltaproteobacteria bacterium]